MIDTERMRTINFAGKLDTGAEFVNTWFTGDPVQMRPGDGTFLPAFEEAVRSMKGGEKRTITIPADQAYGDWSEDNVVTLPANQVPNAEKLPVGGFVQMATPQGPVDVKVVSVNPETVTLDCNHRFAGHDLTFDIEVVLDGTESTIEREEMFGGGCSCGCHKLQEQLMPEKYGHHHHHHHR